MNDIYQLQRFLDAQEAVYPDVVRELRGGRKESHWMWYIFPQVKGLGKSHISQKYALGSLDEATAYVQHPILGNRLHECTEIVVSTEESTVEQIFGYPDYLKFHSSMMLFSQLKNHHLLFDSSLNKYFYNKKIQVTLDTIGGSSI